MGERLSVTALEALLDEPVETTKPKKTHKATYLEDGFTKINNNMLEKMFECLNPYEFLVAMRIYRQTTGFGWVDAETPKREEFSMSLEQIVNGKTNCDGKEIFKGMNISKRHASRIIKSLYEKNIIFYCKGDYTTRGKSFNVYSFNVDYKSWLVKENVKI